MSLTASPITTALILGYDRAAQGYDAWAWQDFWDVQEMPRVEALLDRLALGGCAILSWGAGGERRDDPAGAV